MLWFSSKETEYNLFIYCEHEDIWVPASPNVGEQGDGGTASSYYQDTPPIEDPDNPFSNGDLWIDSTDLTGYVWSDNYWAEMSLDGAVGAGEFVKKDGDTMTGSLTMEDAGQIHMINTDLDFQARMDDDGSGTWDPAVDRFLDIEKYGAAESSMQMDRRVLITATTLVLILKSTQAIPARTVSRSATVMAILSPSKAAQDRKLSLLIMKTHRKAVSDPIQTKQA